MRSCFRLMAASMLKCGTSSRQGPGALRALPVGWAARPLALRTYAKLQQPHHLLPIIELLKYWHAESIIRCFILSM